MAAAPTIHIDLSAVNHSIFLGPSAAHLVGDFNERRATISTVNSRQSVYEGGTPQTPYVASPDQLQPESPLTAEPPRRPNGFDYRDAIDSVEVDFKADPVDPAQLCVAPSTYWSMRSGVVSPNMGDGLFSLITIEPGTRIATFNGTRITRQEARDIPHGGNNYLISMEDDTVLDCMANATARPPLCLASISNQADAAWDPVAQRFLTYHNNNAYTDWRRINGIMVATLYAVRRITGRREEEIMWSYGPSFIDGFDGSTVYTSSVEQDSSFETDFSGSVALSADPQAPTTPLGARRRLISTYGRLRALGFPQASVGYDDAPDAHPEWGFGNDDDSDNSMGSEGSGVVVPSPATTRSQAIAQPASRVPVRRIQPTLIAPREQRPTSHGRLFGDYQLTDDMDSDSDVAEGAL